MTGREFRRPGTASESGWLSSHVLPLKSLAKGKDKPTVTDSLGVKEDCVLSHLGRSSAEVGGRRRH